MSASAVLEELDDMEQKISGLPSETREYAKKVFARLKVCLDKLEEP